CQHGYYILTF
nr:immunoglobulin light chain junction region [Macaca mulatta]